MLDKIVGLAMLVAASAVFIYYTIWTLAMVSIPLLLLAVPVALCANRSKFEPFVDADHPLHSVFPPRVWAIRIPVILILLGSAVVGSFLSVVMIRSNRKKAAKAKAAATKKKA
ncbi:putative Dolichol phosphate-mannose biosynthesis regulatory protein [Seiridium unicorne]|uniref:Dolichol phosphate-mannose biosynthesis regulatory protein n=1 Tax=Seiridium unicorne TaxID=138068 RepID=A0ABR2UW19_9PEZI